MPTKELSEGQIFLCGDERDFERLAHYWKYPEDWYQELMLRGWLKNNS